MLIGVVAAGLGLAAVALSRADSGPCPSEIRSACPRRTAAGVGSAVGQDRERRVAAIRKRRVPGTTRVAHALALPAAAHIWGGNSSAAYRIADVVITEDVRTGVDLAAARRSNPRLIAFTNPQLAVGKPGSRVGGGFAFTYGRALSGTPDSADNSLGLRPWPGVKDTLSPHPLGRIRPFRASDLGCVQADGIPGFNLARATTARLITQAAFYGWKLGRASRHGFDGIWSDNLVPGNVIHAGWFYGSGCPISDSSWDVGFRTIVNRLRSLTGGRMVGATLRIGRAIRRCWLPPMRRWTRYST